MNATPSIKSLSQAILLVFLIQSLSTQAAPSWRPTLQHPPTDVPKTHYFLSTSFKASLEGLKTTLDQITFSFAHSENARTKGDEMANSNVANKFAIVENNIRELQQDLSQFMRNKILLHKDRAILAALETSLKNTQSVLDLQKELLNNEIDKNNDKVEQLMQSLNDFRRELNNANDQLVKKRSEDVMKRMVDQCVQYAQSGFFISASQQLLLLDDSDINYIAKAIYNGQESNFDTLLVFAENVPNDEKALLLYNALYHEMDTNGHNDIFKLVLMSMSLKYQFFDTPMVSGKVKSQAQLLIDTLNETIESLAVKSIGDAFVNDRMSSVCQLKTDLRLISFDYMKKIFNKGIDNGWNRIPSEDKHATLQRFMNELETLYDETHC